MTEISQDSVLEPLLNTFTNFIFVLKSLILTHSVEHTKLAIIIRSEVYWDIMLKEIERIEVIEMGQNIRIQKAVSILKN